MARFRNIFRFSILGSPSNVTIYSHKYVTRISHNYLTAFSKLLQLNDENVMKRGSHNMTASGCRIRL